MHDSLDRRLIVAAIVILGAAVALSCGESPTVAEQFGPPAFLNVVTGNGQTGSAGQNLPEPLTVQVLDLAGHALPGVTVSWNLLAGNGTLFARAFPTVTDSAGLVLVLWQLGPQVGDQQVSAQVGQLPMTVFTAQAQISPSQRLTLISGGGQQDTIGATLAQPLVIRVLNGDGTPDIGAAVAWRAISRGSRYSPTDTRTDSLGMARTSWTLGTVAGPESTAVFVSGFAPRLIVATARPGAPVRMAVAPRAFPALGVIGDTVWVTTSAWDRYQNLIDRAAVFGVTDTIARTLGGPGTYEIVQARHHGSAFITAQIDALRDSVPLTVLGFSGVSVGGSHICGLSLAGDAYCWGEENSSGSIGDGTTTARQRPVLIGAGLGLQVPYTNWHTCALDVSGQAYCWGLGQDGELGDGSPNYATELRQRSPVPVAGGHRFSSIQSGRSHTCAVALNGDAYCWGANYSGQVGRDTVTVTCYGGTGPRCSDWPILVAGGLQFANVTTSVWEHSCGVTTSGGAYCWGLNASGQLGNDSTTDQCSAYPQAFCSYTPRLVEGGIVFKSVSAGDYYTCGVSTSGDGYCWGSGYYGQLGNGAFNNSTVPVEVAGGLSFVDVQAAPHEACGLTTAGTLYCWGTFVATPAPVMSNLVFASFALGTEGGSTRACALTRDNDLYCWYQAIF